MDGRYKTWKSKTLCRAENIKKSDREQKFQQDNWRRNHEYKRTYSN